MDHSEVKHLPRVDHTPAELDEVSRRLLRAAKKIEQSGWYDGKKKGGYCAWAAIVCAEEERVAPDDIGKMAGERLVKSLGFNDISSVFPWNDRVGKDAVLAKLRAVALGL